MHTNLRVEATLKEKRATRRKPVVVLEGVVTQETWNWKGRVGTLSGCVERAWLSLDGYVILSGL